jgi:uncharacterized protein (TIGR02145 family)
MLSLIRNPITKIKLIVFFVLLFVMFTGQLSAQATITDIDGNVYETVVIGNQRWITSNLRVKTYRNGDPIPQIQDPTAWSNARFGAWCYFNNDPSTEEQYGVLYNAYAFLDPRGLAPEGTYVTSMCDWAELYITIEGRNVNYDANRMADKIKVPEFFSYNFQPNPDFYSNPTNSSGLSINYGGQRSNFGFFVNFENKLYQYSLHWTTTKPVSGGGSIPLFYTSAVVDHSYSWRYNNDDATNGLPIRLIVGEEAEKFTYVSQEQAFCGSNQVSQLQFSVQKPNSFGCAKFNEPDCYTERKWYRDIDLTILANPNELMKDGDIYFGKADYVPFNINEKWDPQCREEILEITVRILEPKKPTGPENQVRCAGGTIEDLTAVGDEIRWYPSLASTTALAPGTVLQNNRLYYAENRIGSCVHPERLRVQVELVSPSAPVAAGTQEICEGGLLADLEVDGENLIWFSESGVILPADTAVGDDTLYFVASVVGECESPRTSIRVFLGGPAAPAGEENQSFCPGSLISDMVVSGENILWYGSPTGTEQLSLDNSLENGKTYYASQTVDGCEGRNRKAVKISLFDVPLVSAATQQEFCNAATVAGLQATGTNIRWYADQNLTTLLALNTPLENRTYYATQSLNSCEGAALAVQVKINMVNMPQGDTEQGFCTGALVSDLIATGTNVRWFSTATGGSPLAGNLPLQDGATYYGEQTIGSCQSATRLAVRVSINIPQVPGGPSQQEFCEGARVSELQATGTNLIWYRNATGQERLNPNDPIQDGGSYFVSQRIGGCESARKEIRASIIRVQPAIAEGEQQFCDSDSPTVAKLFAVGESIRWYSSTTGGQPLNDSERLLDGQTYYAVNVSVNRGCESSTRTAVRVILQPCEVEVFNLITRDNNTKNEYLKIKNIESFPDNRLEIYNRHGALVWAADGYGQDGKFFNGESNQPGVSKPELGLPTGNYLYSLTYKKPGNSLLVRESGYIYLINTLRK